MGYFDKMPYVPFHYAAKTYVFHNIDSVLTSNLSKLNSQTYSITATFDHYQLRTVL